jgi:ABC-type multidrug transport system ATPase subunit
VFVIAHRIGSVKHADLVIVLEQGRITQMGTHDELLVQEGHYRQIVNLQLYGAGEPVWSGEMPSHLDRMQEFARRSGTQILAEESFDDAAG